MHTDGSTSAASAATWLSYASPLLLRRLRSGRAVPVPDVEAVEGAVVLVDVEGFSSFAERMGRRGNDGVEELATRINDTFATMVESIERYGGVAHSFPGDSVIALWTVDHGTLEDAVLLAARCSLELLEAHRDGELPLKAGLSAGALCIAHVGGVSGRVHLLLSGSAVDEMARAEERSSRGRLIVAEPAWRVLAPHALARSEADGFCEVTTLRPAPMAAEPAPVASTESGIEIGTLRPYLPYALVRQLDAGNTAWLGEFREVTVVFLKLRPAPAGEDLIGPVQAAFAEAQRVVFRHGGDVARFAHDDKGLAVLAVFGLPPASSEDAAARALHAAVEIEGCGPRLHYGCCIGVATGRVFCGTLGAPRRREYSVVGSTANLAARLMQSVESGVLCDRATTEAAAEACRVEGAGRLRLKGFPDALDVFRVGGARPPLPVAARLPDESSAELVGRDREQRRLHAWVEAARGGAAGVVLVRGEAGIGKSALVRDAVRHARAVDAEVVAVACDVVESTGAYSAWGRALATMLRIDSPGSGDAREGRLRETLAQAGLQADLAPLVASLLGLEPGDNDSTREMTGTTRADNVLAVLARLVLHAAARAREARRPLVVVFEDVHWLDPPSWQLIALLARHHDAEAPAMMLSMRSEAAPTWPDWEDALPPARTERVTLAPLTRDGTAEFTRRILHADSLTQQLAQMVWERTRGNPFFCEQLVSALAESAIAGVEGGVASLRVRNPEQAETLVPRSVAAVLTSRLDRLPAPVQLTLKAASVIGAHFSLALLLAIHPLHPDRETLLAHLADAIEMGLLSRSGDDLQTGHFRHAITCDVSYDLLLASQRRELHREIAEHLPGGEESPASQAALFHHWRRSDDEARALQYVDHAGAEAMREGRYHTVVELYGYALERLAVGGGRTLPPVAPGNPPREALWTGHLGKAQVALGLHEAARPNLESCLQRLGEVVPAGVPALALGIAKESGRQFLHRLAPSRWTGRETARGDCLKLAAETYEQLGYVHYSAGQTTHGLHAALRILNLAELAGLPDLMAGSYAVMSMTASVVGMQRLASLYDRRAMRFASRSDDALTRSHVGWVTGLRAAGEADWSLATTRLEAALNMAEVAGDRRQVLNSLQALAWPAWARGDTRRMAELAEFQLAISRESNNRLWEAWALNGQAEAFVMLGDHDAAIRNCRLCLDILSEESDRADEIRALGLLGVSLLRRSRSDEALAAARRGLDLLRGIEMTNFSMFEGVAGTAEVLAAHVERIRERTGSVPTSARREWKLSIDALSRFARTFPIGRPRLHVMRARSAALEGATKEATREFDRARKAADDFGMPHEKGLALLATARSGAIDLESRRRRVHEAIGLLQEGEALRSARELQTRLAGLAG